MGYRFWTIEEVEYLQDKWGQIETVKICKHLNRTYASVKAKVKKIGLGPARQAGEFLCASELAYSINVDKRTIDRYIQKGLKATRKRFGLGSKKNICINIEDFWRFAKKNKELIKFYRFRKGDLPGEPKWVDEVRFKQMRKRARALNTNKEWTDAEDKTLQNMYLNGKTDEEIAIELRRTVISIVCRKSILFLNQKPYWTEKEVQILKEKVKEGLTDKEIGEILGKTVRSVQGKRLNLNIKKVKSGYNKYQVLY